LTKDQTPNIPVSSSQNLNDFGDLSHVRLSEAELSALETELDRDLDDNPETAEAEKTPSGPAADLDRLADFEPDDNFGPSLFEPESEPIILLKPEQALNSPSKKQRLARTRPKQGPRKDEPVRKAGKPGLPQPAGRRPGLFKKLLICIFWTGLGLTIAGLTALFLGYAYLSQDLPSVEGLKNYQPKTVTFFYSADGQVIGEYSHEKRLVRPLKDIPLKVRQAFIAVEDAKFYSHGGINVLAMVRAFYNNLKTDQLQGASTITQQVVRSFFLTKERKIIRKLKEIILAFRLEAALSKDEILYLYLNQIYLGQGAYGVEAAAETYFDKNVEQLTVAEAAMLAGITQSPEGKNPLHQPAEARDRQVHSIRRMLTVNFISPQEAREAMEEIINIVGERPNPNTTVAPYFTEQVRRILAARFGEESLYNDGWRVFTTVDTRAQKAADAAVARGLWEYARRRGFKGPAAHLADRDIARFLTQENEKLPEEGLSYDRLYQAVVGEVTPDGLSIRVGSLPGHITSKNLEWIRPKAASSKLQKGDVIWVRLDPGAKMSQAQTLASLTQDTVRPRSFILESRTDVQAALLSMDLKTGAVVAMVGGRDFRESQFNRATQSQRQPGSSFKPIVYTAAMDNGFTPGSVLIDGPVVIDDADSGRRWKPVNSDRKFLGPMTLYSALVASRNLISIKILERIGFEALDKTALDLGITTRLPHSPPVALGAHGITMPELITAYSAFPNQGSRVEPRYINRIEDRHGNVIANFEPAFHEAISPGTACEITWMLRGVVAQGTGTSVKPLNRPVGGKTGTTNDASDAWFVGFTPELVTAVWLGTDELKPRAVGEVGGRAAGPIFLYYNQEVLKDKPIVDFQVPPEAQLAPGGAFGVCYKAGTIGTGFSETQTETNAEEDFLRNDLLDAGDRPASPAGLIPPEETFLEESNTP
jgi:penicillin-binding protein 1A